MLSRSDEQLCGLALYIMPEWGMAGLVESVSFSMTFAYTLDYLTLEVRFVTSMDRDR